jgi:DNA polymerase III subunit delta
MGGSDAVRVTRAAPVMVRHPRFHANMGGVVSQVPSPKLTPVVLVLGDEELLVSRAISDTVAQARSADPQTEVRELEASSLLPGELAEVLSPSLFGGRRVAVLRNGQDARKELVAIVMEYVKDPDTDVTLVVCHVGGAKGKAFADSLQKAGASVMPAAKISKHRDRLDFVTGEFRRLGGRCTNDAAEALIEAVGHDLRELAAAASQLTADTGGRVDLPTVARYYRGRAEVSGFTVADAAVAGDVAGALEALRWALHTGVDPVPIADALADGVRTVARVASAGRGNAYQLASGLGMPAWKIEKAQRQARGWTPDGLVRAMRAAAECNEAVKGGREDRAYALERTIMQFAQARQSGGAR